VLRFKKAVIATGALMKVPQRGIWDRLTESTLPLGVWSETAQEVHSIAMGCLRQALKDAKAVPEGATPTVAFNVPSGLPIGPLLALITTTEIGDDEAGQFHVYLPAHVVQRL
jgi:hypothetical protein